MLTIELLSTLGITAESLIEKAIDKVADDHHEIIAEKIRSKIDKMIESLAPTIVQEKLGVSIEAILTTAYQPRDEWGEPVRGSKPTCLRDLVKDKALSYLSAMVNDRGEANAYNGNMTRGEYLAHKCASEAVNYACTEQLKLAVDQAKKDVQSLVAKHITQLLLK